MKSLKTAGIAALIVGLGSLSSCAALTQQLKTEGSDSSSLPSSVGVVNTQKILENSRVSVAVNKARQDMENLKQQLQNDMIEKSKKLDEAESKKLPQAELDKMQANFRLEIEKKQKESQDIYYKKQQELEELTKIVEQEVKTLIQDVAKEKKVSVVVDQQIVLFGGVDLTEEVIKKLSTQPQDNTPKP